MKCLTSSVQRADASVGTRGLHKRASHMWLRNVDVKSKHKHKCRKKKGTDICKKWCGVQVRTRAPLFQTHNTPSKEPVSLYRAHLYLYTSEGWNKCLASENYAQRVA